MCSVFAALLIGVVCIFTGSHIVEKESLNELRYLTENQAYKLEAPFEVIEKSANDMSYVISNMADIKKIKGDSFYSANYIEQLNNIIKKFSNCHNNLLGIYLYLVPEYDFNKKQNTYFYAKSSLSGIMKRQKVEENKEAFLKNFYIDDKKIDSYDDILKIEKAIFVYC